MRKRLMSILLCLVMLFSLVPGAAVPVHAFWEDYDTGGDCPNCDHYHWGENLCDCQFCTIDCNYDCWVETHCNDCGLCLGDTPYWCDECYKCAECVDDDDTGVIHCVDCHTSCEQCEECLLAKESCEECGLCKECCEINSEDGGCPDGRTCVESAEWDEHICQGCDGWITDKEDEDEFCQTCELCKECCEGNSDCSAGMCAMDTDYADHFCEDCGLCALITRLKLKTEDRANAKQAHHDKAIALQQPHSFSIKDCTSPYSYTFPYCSNNVPCKKSLFLYSLLTKAKINSISYFDNMGGELRKGHYGGNYV